MANGNGTWKLIATAALSALVSGAAVWYGVHGRLSAAEVRIEARTTAPEVREIITQHPSIVRTEEHVKSIRKSIQEINTKLDKALQ